jgi:hypothetical protein
LSGFFSEEPEISVRREPKVLRGHYPLGVLKALLGIWVQGVQHFTAPGGARALVLALGYRMFKPFVEMRHFISKQ